MDNGVSEEFGKYVLLEQIGQGGMAEVFLAKQVGVEGFEKFAVIKRIRPQFSQDASFVEMFLNEAKLAARLSHSNIVQIYELGAIEDSYFIAMEYIAGRDMSAVIPKAREAGIDFPFEYALRVASNVCEGLYYAHNLTDANWQPLHIVHRDISPENIRIGWNGVVKILDFGIAKAATQLNETRAGEVKGKLGYMSPEQVLGKPLDNRSDIFSLGVVLYEWITGIRLFAGDNELSIMKNIVDGHIYPPSYFKDDLPEAVENIVMKALEKDREKRYQSAFEMQLDIENFLASHVFTPSNIHLSNFINQLFKEEIEAEKERLAGYNQLVAENAEPLPVISTQTGTVTTGKKMALAQSGSFAQVSSPTQKTNLFNSVSGVIRQNPQEGEMDVIAHLDKETAARLRALSARTGIAIGPLVTDMIMNITRYLPEE